MKRVLLVEDDRWQAEHSKLVLKKAGFDIEIAHSSIEAMDLIDKFEPNIIVLDMMLPGANGLTLVHEIRSHADLADLPIILCSSVSLDHASLAPYGIITALDKTLMTADDLVVAVKKGLL